MNGVCDVDEIEEWVSILSKKGKVGEKVLKRGLAMRKGQRSKSHPSKMVSI